MTVPTGEDTEADPGAVSSLADLARELRLLHMNAGSPSVRDIGKALDIAHSSVQDILRGNGRMPNQRRFLALVGHFHPDADIAAWRRAWVRAEMRRRDHPSRPAVPTFAVSAAPASSPTSDNAARISRVNAAEGARLIESEPLSEVVDALAGIQPDRTAARLSRVSATRAAAVLEAIDEANAALILTDMEPGPAGTALDEIPAATAAHLLHRMIPPHNALRIVRMQPSRAAEALQQMPGWPRFLDRHARELDVRDRRRVLAALPDEALSLYLQGANGTSPRDGVELLSGAAEPFLVRLLTLAPPDFAAGWLSVVDPKVASRIADVIPRQMLVDLVRRMPSINDNCAMPLLAAWGEDRLAGVLLELPLDDLSEWIERLRSQLSQPTLEKLANARRARLS